MEAIRGCAIPGQRLRDASRSAFTSILVTFAIAVLSLVATTAAGVQLLANSLLMMGGNENPNAVTPVMQQELGGDPYYPGPNQRPGRPVGVFGQGYVDTANNPASPYYGWDYIPVHWPAQLGVPFFGDQTSFGESQRRGVESLSTAIGSVLAGLGPNEQALAFGYSSSANVVVRTMRELQRQAGGAPGTDQLQFFLLGNPNRPNGGLLQRFAGLYVPFVDAAFDGTTPLDTPYQTIDVSWEYDGAADFPTYPLNLLAVWNSLIELHGNYFRADMNGPRAMPDVTVGNITYVTLAAPHLPLLLPLYNMGFATPLLDLIEPVLTVMVDWGYDRTISPGTPTTARLIPRINPVTATVDLINAVATGINNFVGHFTPSRTPSSSTPVSNTPVSNTPVSNTPVRSTAGAAVAQRARPVTGNAARASATARPVPARPGRTVVAGRSAPQPSAGAARTQRAGRGAA